MKRIDDLLINAKEQIQKPKPYQKEVTDDQWALSFSLINRLFEELTAIFNASHQTWRTSEELERAKKQWLIGLVENRIFDWERIEIALTKCRRYPKAFCPNIGEFISWCQYSPEDFGLPAARVAYNEAIKYYGEDKFKENKTWSHKVVEYAAYYTGSYELMSLSDDKAFARFDQNYQRVVSSFIGGTLGDLKKALPHGINDEQKKREAVTDDKFKQVRNGSDALRLMKAML
jgi:hypothetical protein